MWCEASAGFFPKKKKRSTSSDVARADFYDLCCTAEAETALTNVSGLGYWLSSWILLRYFTILFLQTAKKWSIQLYRLVSLSTLWDCRRVTSSAGNSDYVLCLVLSVPKLWPLVRWLMTLWTICISSGGVKAIQCTPTCLFVASIVCWTSCWRAYVSQSKAPRCR